MIQVNRLVKIYKGSHDEQFRALDGVSFEVPDGQFFTLLGPSGCGKTTLLRLIAGLERPQSGEIRIDHRLVCSAEKKISVPAHERNIGMVFQSYAIWPHMSVFENVAFPLKVSKQKFNKEEVQKRVEFALSTVRLEGFKFRPATNLSGGQQQRLALARALVREPTILLLDEPLSNLDAKLREELRIELRQLQRKLRITTIYVTHDQAEALAMSNTVAIMSQGRIVQQGRPREIYEQPSNKFTADFIGSTNFLPGRVLAEHSSKAYRCVQVEHGLISCLVPEEIQSGEEVVISIRPKNIVASRETIPSAANNFAGILRESAFLGEYVDCQVEVGNSLIRVFIPPHLDIQKGETVNLYLPGDYCKVIPQDTNGSK